LEYRVIEGSCHSGEVLGYLEALAKEAQRGEGKPRVVVLDNAPFHTAGVIREREPQAGRPGRVEVVPTAGLLPTPELDRGCMAKAQGLPDATPFL
jgi:hypothetical protein